MNEIADTLSKLGELKISDELPAGINIRYDDEYEFIEDELSKQGSLIDRGGVDWNRVVHSCVNILQEKSKDIKVSCYLIRALYEIYGVSGLKTGLKINYELLRNFWDDSFPVKQRAKINSYEWLSSKFESIFAKISVGQVVLQDIQPCYDSIVNIEQFLNEKLEDKAPALGYFRRSIHDLLENCKDNESNLSPNNNTDKGAIIDDADSDVYHHENKPVIRAKADSNKRVNLHENTNAEVTAPVKTKGSDVPFKPLVDVGNINEQDKNKLIRQCQDVLRKLSACEIKQTLDTPSAYAMTRFTTWMGIHQLPIHKDNLTPLKPIPVDKINHYKVLFKSKKYQELIPLVEQSFAKSPFWLDAHRLVFHSLENLGFVDSAAQVKEQMGVFLRRFPDLIHLKYSDHSPFADESTKQWVLSEILAQRSGEEALLHQSDSDSEYPEIEAQAMAKAKENNYKEGVKIFYEKIKSQENMRNKILWKYHLAKFCYDISKYKLAYFLLQEIDGFLEKYNIKYWEPDLEKKVVHLLFVCMKNSDEIEESQNKGELTQLYSRLCQLDPVLALDIH